MPSATLAELSFLLITHSAKLDGSLIAKRLVIAAWREHIFSVLRSTVEQHVAYARS